ncbi:hypothetical protein GCM10010140_60570 [Streptosporangium pseudovulgare]|uniref:Uncharacterized protein n=1 Tax=Streptosporangium pseudovulgare TaxID=35765 RepID=A0ABQ2RAI6_9ACTN|nr:hypothetical protein GCM10010140_60570 [Streptosporangium pseudovulgare]
MEAIVTKIQGPHGRGVPGDSQEQGSGAAIAVGALLDGVPESGILAEPFSVQSLGEHASW